MTEKKKFDGSVSKVAECLVGDSTGCGVLIAKNGKELLAAHPIYLTGPFLEHLDIV